MFIVASQACVILGGAGCGSALGPKEKLLLAAGMYFKQDWMERAALEQSICQSELCLQSCLPGNQKAWVLQAVLGHFRLPWLPIW